MNGETILFLLILIILILLFLVLYQRFLFHRGIEKEITQINEQLAEISKTDSDEKVMVFTDNPVIMELGDKINRLLTDRQKIKAEFKREEISSRKMLANISHDIKTPLTVILGYLELMRLDRAEDEMLKKTEDKAKQVMNLMDQFFTLAKLESGDMDITLCKVDISEVCRETVLAFYDILTQKEVQVELAIPEHAVYVQGDVNALERLLYNLLSNAIRYGMAGNYLGVFVWEDENLLEDPSMSYADRAENSIYIDVVDKGKGIAPEYVSHVFDRLYTMEDSRNREIQGNGLGLTIAKNLARELGGDLFLNSVPNEKTTFTVRLKKYI